MEDFGGGFWSSAAGGWTIFGLISLGTAAVAGAIHLGITYYNDHLARRREIDFRNMTSPDLKRSKIDCMHNNFGCANNICWTNCGPRLHSDDYCFTTAPNDTSTRNHQVQLNENRTMLLAICINDNDCNSCWPCANSCTYRE